MSEVSLFNEQFELTHAIVGWTVSDSVQTVQERYVLSKEQSIAPGMNNAKCLPHSFLVAHTFASL